MYDTFVDLVGEMSILLDYSKFELFLYTYFSIVCTLFFDINTFPLTKE